MEVFALPDPVLPAVLTQAELAVRIQALVLIRALALAAYLDLKPAVPEESIADYPVPDLLLVLADLVFDFDRPKKSPPYF